MTRVQVYLAALAVTAACIASLGTAVWLFDAGHPAWGALAALPAAAMWLHILGVRLTASPQPGDKTG